MNRVLVTGGAGFIGSHLVDRLLDEYEVVVLDDLSGGDRRNIAHHADEEEFRFIEGSITTEEDVATALEGVDTVFHFAAQPDVRLSVDQPLFDFRINVVGTMNILESMRERDINRFIFASSGGTVYGETDVFPTPESTPFRPISNYGAAKGAVEMYLSSYAELYGINSVSMRLANIIGPRSTHGVMYDFYMKLKRDPTRLEVLGDGQQEKSYMYVSDTVDATMLLAEKMPDGYQPVNVGSGERLKVARIAELVRESAGVPEATIDYTGSERGWAGDVVITDIDISLLRSYGWEPEVPLEQGVREYIQWLADRYGSVE
ncbi:MAG: NAD-dependent epimerase/dehydratase family protein [Candidatus Thorarchaeota archaeon]|nr:NAD-dependent epimerase/dehydratase family protein [Candidatus Thorarchaeota archaeon]